MKKALFTFIVFLSLFGNDCLAQTHEERVDRICSKVRVDLPQGYGDKIKGKPGYFVNLGLLPELGEVMETFFVDQMKIDRGINKSNQLCFLWELLARLLKQKDGLIYDPSSDTNVQRRADWNKFNESEISKRLQNYISIGISKGNLGNIKIAKEKKKTIPADELKGNKAFLCYSMAEIKKDGIDYRKFFSQEEIAFIKNWGLDLNGNILYWYTKAAELGDEVAQNQLAECYSEGEGVAKDMTKAVYWHTKAAEQGHKTSQCELGDCYRKGEGVTKDLSKAVYWYTKSAEQGYDIAQCELGDCYRKGEGVTKDLSKAVYWYTKSAEQGWEYAQWRLGRRYEVGEGVAKDMKKAVYWYTKAAEQGNSTGQYYLANCYENGSGVAKDLSKAFTLYKKAAEQGNEDAQYDLAWCYRKGDGVTKDMAKAITWFTKAAGKGNKFAQYDLAKCYEKGNGVNQSWAKAAEWYGKAADQGYAKAIGCLGDCYAEGRGVAKDIAKAKTLWIKAAESGHADSQELLYLGYEVGDKTYGFEKNPQKAAYWKKKYNENPNKGK